VNPQTREFHLLFREVRNTIRSKVKEIQAVRDFFDTSIFNEINLDLIALDPSRMKEVNLERNMLVAPNSLFRVEANVAILVVGEFANLFRRLLAPILERCVGQLRGALLQLIVGKDVGFTC